MRALACPASLKGVLSAADGRSRTRGRASRAAAPKPTSCRSPTAARGPPRRCGSRSAATGASPTVHDAFGRPRARAGSRSRTGRPSSRLRPPVSARSADGSTRSQRPAAASASSSLPCSTTGRRRCCSALGGTATMDGGRGLARASSSELPRAGPRRLRRDAPRSPRRRGSSGRRRAPAPAEVAELERRFAAERACAVSRAARCAALPAGSVRRSPSLGAELVPGAALVLDAIGFDAVRATTSSSPARAGSTRRRARARRRARSRGAARRGHALRRLRRRRSTRAAAGRRDGRALAAIRRGRATTWSRSGGGSRVEEAGWRASASRSLCASAWTSFHAIRESVSTIGRNSQSVIA